MNKNYKGITSDDSIELLKKYGLNEISKKELTLLDRIFKQIFSFISLMLILASVLSLISNKFFDFIFILVLLLINIVITIFQESKADKTIKNLNKSLSSKVNVYRDNQWTEIDSKLVVPEDIVKYRIGDIIIADGEILEDSNLSLNMSSLTGESLPVEKKTGDTVFSGAYISTGLCIVKVTATGNLTYFGKTIFSIDTSKKKSSLEKDILNISKFLTILSLFCVLILTLVLLIINKNILEILELDLSLVIAGVPISLPTVMTLIIEIGVINLAKKNVIVRRLSALEDFSNVNLLLTDKTGTLTENKLKVSDIALFNNYSQTEFLEILNLITSEDVKDPINFSILNKIKNENICPIKDYKKINFIPFDSKRKHSTLILNIKGDIKTYSFGAPQVILFFPNTHNNSIQYIQTIQDIQKKLDEFSDKGFRTLILSESYGDKEESVEIIGLIALSDTLRTDAVQVIDFLKENGVSVKMVSGDNEKVVRETASQLPLQGTNILTHIDLAQISNEILDKDTIDKAKAFAEVLPDEKYRIIKSAKNYYCAAATGDGINDLPSIRESNVGIAVSNAVSALKASADIILLTPGIIVIKDSILESRKIFKRLYTYSTYRISESLRLVVTILILGIVSGNYPLTAIQIIMIALLNDIPIISLAFDTVDDVKPTNSIHASKKFKKSILFGAVGVMNSMLMYIIVIYVFKLPYTVLQSIFFLKLTVSGHLLLFVARTNLPWFKSKPAKPVLYSTIITQAISTIIVFTGFLMPSPLSLTLIAFVWIWAFFWMQVSEFTKKFH